MASSPSPDTISGMRILVIGGTRFAGHHFSRFALEAGHELTLFNRGESDPGAFPDAEHVQGDRDGGLEPLRGRAFDSVVAFCGYIPWVVPQSVELLAPTCEHYLFVSSISVYDESKIQANFDETAPTRDLEDPTVEEITGDTYGGLKVLCEREVQRRFTDRSLVVRPGLIVGPLDRSDRFMYWVRRISRGGEVLSPGRPDRPVQVIDARCPSHRRRPDLPSPGPDRARHLGLGSHPSSGRAPEGRNRRSA